MRGSFHSRFGIDALPDQARSSFRDALRLAAEKGGQAWICEDGDVVAALVLTERLAEEAAGRASCPACLDDAKAAYRADAAGRDAPTARCPQHGPLTGPPR